MKILSLGLEPKLFEEGSEARCRIAGYGDIAEELHIVVYTPPGFKQEKIARNVFVYPTNSASRLLYFFDAYRIGRKILDKGFLITSQEGMTNIVAVFLKLRFNLPLEVQVHTDFQSPFFRRESFKNRLRYIGYRFGVSFADSVRTVSKRVKESLSSVLNVSEEKINILPIFVDIDGMRSVSPTFDLHKKYERFDFIVVMISRLTKEKNVSMAISALKNVVASYPNTGLVIVGDGPMKKSLKKDAREARIEQNVMFDPWTSDTISYYKTADAYLLTSNYEGYGRTLIEAAASDCPIVTTDVGVAGDIFEDHTGALICPVGGTECVSEKIIELIENPKLRAHLKLNAQRDIQSVNLSRTVYLSKMLGCWKKCGKL